MDFETFFQSLKTELLELIKQRFNKESQEIKDEAFMFLEGSKEKLRRWTQLLAQGVITKAEFEVLLSSQKDLMIMTALYRAGVSKIRLGHFKNAVVKLILNKALILVGI